MSENHYDQHDDVDDQADEQGEDAGRRIVEQRTEVEMSDGTKFTVRVTNRDKLQWDKTAPRRKWGKATDVPFLAQTFITWCAARREGKTELKWEAFEEACYDLTDVDIEDSDVVRPTNLAAGAPSS